MSAHPGSRKIRQEAEAHVSYDKDPGTRIAYVTLKRQERQNAVTAGMRLLLADAIQRANIDDEVKVLVLRAEGPDFGSGGDLAEEQAMMADMGAALLRELDLAGEDVRYPLAGSFRELFTAYDVWAGSGPASVRPFQNFRKISIVQAQGYCYGWHFFMAADADIVIASDDALFGHPSFRWAGWAPRMWTWLETMGQRKFMEMLLTGRPFTAAEMQRCGFANSVVPIAELAAETEKYALACSRTRPTDTVVAQKTFFEIYKQFRGEYFGSLLTAMIEGILPAISSDAATDIGIDEPAFRKGLNNVVKDNDLRYPPHWRLSRAGRARP